MKDTGTAGSATASELAQLRTLARIMDDSLRVPGTSWRFGLDALIGLVPGFGDVAAGLTTSYVIVAAQKLGAPRSVLLRMVWNVFVDTVFGSIPFLGDLFDAGYKANLRNVRLLETYLASPVRTKRASRAFMALLLGLIGLIVAGGLLLTFVLVRALLNALF